MSLPEQNQDQYQEQNGEFDGGRKRRHTAKKHNKKNVVVVGKVYADWCGHCQSLKPEWAKMKKRVYSKKGRKHVVFVEVEEKQIGNKLRKLEQEHGVKVEANGYPTLFRIESGKVKYYNGNRQSDEMTNWYLRGGDPEEKQGDLQMPGLMEDLQGGKRRLHGTKRRDSFARLHGTKRRFRHHGFRRYPNTLKDKPPNNIKKSSGFLSFLFGK
jgi:thiol-disulfide isomerase/thioredoxin